MHLLRHDAVPEFCRDKKRNTPRSRGNRILRKSESISFDRCPVYLDEKYFLRDSTDTVPWFCALIRFPKIFFTILLLYCYRFLFVYMINRDE